MTLRAEEAFPWSNRAQQLRLAIGLRIARRRRVNGWSQMALAVRIGGRVRRISAIERGHRAPCLIELVRLGGAFGVSISELVAGVPLESPARQAMVGEETDSTARNGSPEELRRLGMFMEGLVLQLKDPDALTVKAP